MDLQQLRRATAPDHDRTEAAVPLMGADLSRETYVAALQRFHRIICGWESWTHMHAPEDCRPLLTGRSRCGLLEDDLRSLGAERFAPSESGALGRDFDALMQPGSDSRAAFLGAMYVVEGSTLGGQYIARHVEQTLGLEPGSGNSYFRGYGAETMPRWREFQAVLQAVPESEAPKLISSAKAMFRIFGKWMAELPANPKVA